MTDKHTPGPWSCERQDGEGGEIYHAVHAHKDYAFIANVYGKDADARLIAAAPDLLVVVRSLVLNERQLNDEHFAGVQERFMALAREALAKATGEP